MSIIKASRQFDSFIDARGPNAEGQKGTQMYKWRRLLYDAHSMISEEIRYMKTGKHPGVPMRDALGQWESLAQEIREYINKTVGDKIP